jgi:uncharacterized lipoprotein YbaY
MREVVSNTERCHPLNPVRRWLAVSVLRAGMSAHPATSLIAGKVLHLERNLQPPQATLGVTLQDAPPADTPAGERASISLRLRLSNV